MSSSVLSGLSSSSSGMDVGAVVDTLIEAERAPETLMQRNKSDLAAQRQALADFQQKVQSLQDRLDVLKDPLGVFTATTAESTDASVFTASADATAAAGTHTVVVKSLASGSAWYTKAFGSTDTISAGTTFRISTGSGADKTVTFDRAQTLQQAADYLNTLGLEANIFVSHDAVGSRLAITSTGTGAAAKVSISEASVGLGMECGSAGGNASILFDGVPVESAGNIFEDVLPGVNISVTAAKPDTPLTLKLAADKSQASTAVSTFVTAYNTVMKSVNAQFTYDAASGSSGVLAADSTLRDAQQQLLTIASRSLDKNGAIGSLASLGIRMNDDGSLTLDDAALSSALASDFDAVKTFFQDKTGGFAILGSSELDRLSDTTSGTVAVDIKGIDDSTRSISDQIDAFETRLASRRKQLTDEYTRIDVLLRQFSATQAQLTAQLSALKTS